MARSATKTAAAMNVTGYAGMVRLAPGSLRSCQAASVAAARVTLPLFVVPNTVVLLTLHSNDMGYLAGEKLVGPVPNLVSTTGSLVALPAV
jgi:hypothetical protein